MTDVSLRILLSAIGGAGVISMVQNIGNSLGQNGLGGALLGVGAAAAGMTAALGVQAVQAAGNFQGAMDLNVAHAGLAKDQVNSVSQAVLNMAPALGQMPDALAKALYPVLSSFSGISDQSAKAQISLTELKDAGMSVAGTTTDVTSVTNAASAAFNAYGLSTNDTATNTARMNNLFDVMNNTVSAGNMQWNTYATMIGKLSVASHGAGVGFNEENAALADLTNQGFSAQLAGTYLSNTFNDLYTKADNLQKNAKKLGISFDETKYKSMDFAGRIEYLRQVTDNNQSSLLKLMGGNSIALKTYDALSNSIGSYKSNLDSLNNSQGATATAFQTASSGFNFAMQKLQAAGQVLLITIGTGLLPAIGNLVSGITPLVTNFTSWISSGHATNDIMTALQPVIAYLGPIVQQLGGALQHLGVVVLPLIVGFGQWLVNSGTLHASLTVVVVVVGLLMQAVTLLANALANIIGFFRQNQVALDLLLAVLGTVALQILSIVIPAFIGMAVTMLSTMIPAFIATSIAAIGAAVGILIAWWPLIFAFLLVTAVIFGIIEVVQHWGAIAAWLQGAWSSVVSFFQGVWSGILSGLSAIGGFFTSVWSGIVSGLQSAWNAIVSVVQAGISFVQNIITTVFNAIAASFIWLYEHNRYIKALVDNIVNIVRTGISLLQSAWSAIVGWITFLWQGLVSIATTVWNAVTGAINTAVTAVTSALTTAWNATIGALTIAWNAVAGVATTAWNAVKNAISTAWGAVVGVVTGVWSAISGIFSGAWNTYIAKPLNDVWNWFTGWFSQLANGALNSGKNFINMLVNGITSGVGAIWNAVVSIAQNIWKALGFSSPAQAGPGATADKWMPNLVNMLSSGLTAGAPKMQTAANAVVQPVASALSGGGISPTSAASHTSGGTTHNYNFTINLSTMARSQSEVNNLVDMMDKAIGAKFRNQTSGYASGGIY